MSALRFWDFLDEATDPDGVPAELHIYAGSGHGFGLRTNDTKPAAKWIEHFEEWLAGSGFLKKP